MLETYGEVIRAVIICSAAVGLGVLLGNSALAKTVRALIVREDLDKLLHLLVCQFAVYQKYIRLEYIGWHPVMA